MYLHHYGNISNNKSHILVIRSTHTISTDNIASEALIIPGQSTSSAPKHGSPLALGKPPLVDITPPSSLSPQRSKQVGYSEVSVSCLT